MGLCLLFLPVISHRSRPWLGLDLLHVFRRQQNEESLAGSLGEPLLAGGGDAASAADVSAPTGNLSLGARSISLGSINDTLPADDSLGNLSDSGSSSTGY